MPILKKNGMVTRNTATAENMTSRGRFRAKCTTGLYSRNNARLIGCSSSRWIVPANRKFVRLHNHPGRNLQGSALMRKVTIAGTSVIASIAAKNMAKFLVKARGLKSLPSYPVSVKIGMKDTEITRSEKKDGPPTSLTACNRCSL